MFKSTLAAMAAVFALSALSPAAMAAKGDPHVLLTIHLADQQKLRQTHRSLKAIANVSDASVCDRSIAETVDFSVSVSAASD